VCVVCRDYSGYVQVCAIKFAEGKAHFRSKYVKTTGYMMEKKAQKLIFKGTTLVLLPPTQPSFVGFKYLLSRSHMWLGFSHRSSCRYDGH
jgi:hypothetical protein